MKKKYIASLAGVVLAAGLGFVGYKYSAFEEAAAAIAHGAGVGAEYREFSEALNGGAKDKTKRPAGKKEKAIAFYYTNSKSSQTMSSAAVSVDDIELLTGMDFFVNLDKKTEKRVEATYNLSDWK